MYLISQGNFLKFRSGVSEGEYVTLGHHEQDDIKTVVEYLENTGLVTTICLWGRSMGAVSSLLYSANHPEKI